ERLKTSVTPNRSGDQDHQALLLLRSAWLIDAVAVATVVLLQLLGGAKGSNPNGFSEGVFGRGLMLIAMLAIVAAALISAVGILRNPIRDAVGRWASWLALFNICFLPACWLLAKLLTALGVGFEVSWGLPYLPIWAATGLAAIALGAFAPGARKQGWLIFPLLLGAAALTFFLGDMV
ncbi:MAG: hypothetical protein WCL20_09050, partial [Actinomycetes bacterium]